MNNLSNFLKDVVNTDEYKVMGIHWIVLYIHHNNVTYFDSFSIEHIPKKIKKYFGEKKIIKKSSEYRSLIL